MFQHLLATFIRKALPAGLPGPAAVVAVVAAVLVLLAALLAPLFLSP
ncbi:hypothetical protein [Desulfocurvus sp.]|jgi:hypothetical protein|nr:hypothetical protein [Desulfocurvus sp.]MCK9240734.1 hypothetical protein [Desulfocurvus sp.]